MLAEVTFDAEHQKQTQIEQESFFSCSNVFALQWTWIVYSCNKNDCIQIAWFWLTHLAMRKGIWIAFGILWDSIWSNAASA